jgi:hypothetical protein
MSACRDRPHQLVQRTKETLVARTSGIGDVQSVVRMDRDGVVAA